MYRVVLTVEHDEMGYHFEKEFEDLHTTPEQVVGELQIAFSRVVKAILASGKTTTVDSGPVEMRMTNTGDVKAE